MKLSYSCLIRPFRYSYVGYPLRFGGCRKAFPITFMHICGRLKVMEPRCQCESSCRRSMSLIAMGWVLNRHRNPCFRKKTSVEGIRWVFPFGRLDPNVISGPCSQICRVPRWSVTHSDIVEGKRAIHVTWTAGTTAEDEGDKPPRRGGMMAKLDT